MKPLLRAVKRRFRRLRRPRNPAIILMYHSISDPTCDPWDLCVSPAAFAEHLEVLRQRANVLPLGELLDTLDQGTFPDRGVAITFDDGYADNLHTAKPLLERFDLPATVFVTAGRVNTRGSFWWDEITQLILLTPDLPEEVRLDIEGRPFHFSLGPDARIEALDERYQRWRYHEPPLTRRHLLYQMLWRQLQPLPGSSRRRALFELRKQVGQPHCLDCERGVMNANGIVDLARSGLIEVGAHTMTHPVLSRLPAPKQADEIRQSKETLEQILDRPVSSFSYPHGGRGDYTRESIQAVRDAGLRSACTTTENWLRSGCDRYQLPRIHVPPVSGEDFERLLNYWL